MAPCTTYAKFVNEMTSVGLTQACPNNEEILKKSTRVHHYYWQLIHSWTNTRRVSCKYHAYHNL